jgi:hypothetical protein
MTCWIKYWFRLNAEYLPNKIYMNPVRTSQETHHISATRPNLLMLFGETVAVYCENHAEHTHTHIYISSVRTSQETLHLATKPNRLMLFGETVAVYCENYTEHTDIYKLSSYLTGNTLRLRYKVQPVNAVWGKSRCLLWEPCGTHRYAPWAECRVLLTKSEWYWPLKREWNFVLV